MYRFKKAEAEAEFEQIFRLNHAVFARELRQYAADSSARLVDKFHDKNLYVIAVSDEEVVGMIAAHDRPPFSIVDRLPDPGVLEQFGRLIEVRLLAIDPAHRSGMVLAGLFLTLYQHVRKYDAVAISGRVEECPMYHRLGFHDLGPPVRSGQAEFVPMALRVADLARREPRWRRRLESVRGPMP
ncbi:MAG: hypothetical protein DMG59_00965 [Acidobacteria bacterium]|nr:MAG: hypothetical protein DMG59_00965 [Acidobacteriota bacterium]